MTKPTKWHVRPAKTQISLGICQVWSESSWSAWWKLGSLATYWAPAKTLIRLGGCPGWSQSSLGAHATLLVLSWGGSYLHGAFLKLPHVCCHLIVSSTVAFRLNNKYSISIPVSRSWDNIQGMRGRSQCTTTNSVESEDRTTCSPQRSNIPLRSSH